MRVKVIQLEERYTCKDSLKYTHRDTHSLQIHCLLYALRPRPETLEMPIFRFVEEDVCNKHRNTDADKNTEVVGVYPFHSSVSLQARGPQPGVQASRGIKNK